MPTTSTTPTYTDLSLYNAHKPHGDIVEDIFAIHQAVATLLETPIGSRLFRPTYGSSLNSLLFRPMSLDTEFLILSAVIEAITIWEDRVTVDTQLSTVTANISAHAYDVKLVLIIKGVDNFNSTFFKQFKVRT